MWMQNLAGRKALLYRRVSSDDQVQGYSLRAQDEALRGFCDRHGIEVVAVFEDDGYSAKDFDRPAWKRLTELVKQERGVADLLLFTKWSRFGRNLGESIAWVEELRLRRGVQPQAIEQWMNYDDPNHVYQLAFALAEPDVSNRWLSINTKQGMRRAAAEGRWTTTPPVGYRRALDADERMILVEDEVAGPLLREAFERAADTRVPLDQIRLDLRKRGLDVGRSTFFRVLRNVVYIGKGRVPAWKDEPERLVDGLHAPLIDELVFQRVQARLSETARSARRVPTDPDLVLRGHLVCPACGRVWTGSLSRGKLGQRYAYYHCWGGCDVRAAAGEVNDALAALLGSLQLAPEVSVLYRAVLQEHGRESQRQRAQRRTQVLAEVQAVEEKLARADEAFVEGRINAEAYGRLRERYEATRTALRLERARLADVDDRHSQGIGLAVDLLGSLTRVWREADAPLRSELVGSMFPEKLAFRDGVLRTLSDTGLFALLGRKNAEMQRPAPVSTEAGPIRLPG